MCQIFITVWVGFTTYNNEPIQDFGLKFRGGCYAGLWAEIQGGGAMQDFGPTFCFGGGGADARQCAFTRHFTVHVNQCQYMLLYIIILHKNMVSVIQHGSGRTSVG